MGNSFGLKEGDIKSIISILQQQPEVEEALIFGSRREIIKQEVMLTWPSKAMELI
ncbi:MAG TPA: hypothetical protein VIQ00_10495 [Chitinophagaceae bacterium]